MIFSKNYSRDVPTNSILSTITEGFDLGAVLEVPIAVTNGIPSRIPVRFHPVIPRVISA